MSDALIKAQDNILKFLMEGPKGRLDFWNNQDFMVDPTKERGIYPRKNLHLLQDVCLIEKIYIDRKVHWKLVEGAYFRMDGKEYEWSYDVPKITKDPIYVETAFSGNDIVEISIVQKPVDEACVIEEIENDDYLDRAKKALVKPKKSWLKKLKLW